MINPITTLENPGASLRPRTILSKEGFTCNLLTLEPAVQTPIAVADGADACILFVIEGDVTVREGAVNTILGKDQALLVRGGADVSVTARAGSPTKMLRTDVPPRQTVTPQIIELPR